jgi:hypothetical protein
MNISNYTSSIGTSPGSSTFVIQDFGNITMGDDETIFQSLKISTYCNASTSAERILTLNITAFNNNDYYPIKSYNESIGKLAIADTTYKNINGSIRISKLPNAQIYNIKLYSSTGASETTIQCQNTTMTAYYMDTWG